MIQKNRSKNTSVASYNMMREYEYDVADFKKGIDEYEKEKLEFM